MLRNLKKKYMSKDMDDLNERSLVLNQNTRFRVAESYKATRTNIMFAMAGDKKCKKIIITSSVPGEGKTVTCVNLAITFSQTGARVLYIDADLRRPKGGKLLNLNDENGLSNVLGGFLSLDDVIIKNVTQGLDCITAGHIPPNPSELLASNKMKEILDQLETQYNYIFIDTPPVTVVTDAASLVPSATGVIIVSREKYTQHAMLKSAIAALQFANAKILGLILNDSDEENSYSYRNKYGRYGYQYGNQNESTYNTTEKMKGSVDDN